MIFWEPIIWSDNLYFGLGYSTQSLFQIIMALWVATGIYFIGNFAFIFARKSVLYMLIYSELILLGINLMYILLSLLTNTVDYQIFSLLLLVLAGVETVVGLSLAYILHTQNKSTSLPFILQN